jgi:hypothetical protein
MMVNKLGQMARGLRSYHAAQNEPAPAGVKHETPEDMKPADTWHLCEMGVITKSIDTLLHDVQKVNAEKPQLEEKRQIASKGFIKRKLPPLPALWVQLLTNVQSTPWNPRSSVS